MKDGGRHDEYAPDSTLEGIEPGAYYDSELNPGMLFKVRVNDFIDLGDSLPEDPIWGSSFQVVELLPGQVVVKMYDPISDLYYLTNVDIRLADQNYELSPFVDTLPEGAIKL
jgi:hypothetical protein